MVKIQSRRRRCCRLLLYELFKNLRSPELFHFSYYTVIILIRYVLICISIDSLVWFQNHLILYSTFKRSSMYLKILHLKNYFTTLAVKNQMLLYISYCKCVLVTENDILAMK